MHPAPSMSVRKERDVGRPYDVDLSAPFDQQFGKKFVERFIGNAAWLLRIKKDKYRKQASDRKYVPARVADAFAEQILSELEPEFLRLAAELGDEFDERFQDQVKALKRRLGYYEDKLYERDELKRLVMMRERNLDQINLDRKRITRAASR